jgi:hypothetical protein
MKWYIALTVLLAGCATEWRHPMKGAAEYERDYYECEKDAAPQQDVIRWRGMMERCLRSKGWREQ